MKIVIVDTTVHGPLIGGGHLFLPGLMKGLTKKGHEVHLVTQGEPNEKLVKPINESGAIVHKRPWGKTGLVEDTAPVFARWVNKLHPDIYMISASYDIGWVALPLLNGGIATITIGHNDSETFYLPVRHYRSYITKAIGVSNQICDHYVVDCHIDPSNVEWLPYGVEASTVEPVDNLDGPLRIVYVGRIVEEQKRISDVIAIAKSLEEKKINFKLTIIGDGPQMPELKSKLADEIKKSIVELKGWLENPEVIKMLKQSEIFILTSAYEGFCIALVEAMANGCCPVVTDIRSGNKQLIDDAVSGFLVEIGNTAAFVEKLSFLAANPARLKAMRKQAWKKGESFSIPAMISAYENCFVKAVTSAKLYPREIDPAFPLMSTTRSKYPNWVRRLKF